MSSSKGSKKSKDQLIAEIEKLRNRISELESMDSEYRQIRDALYKSEYRYRRFFMEDLTGNFLSSVEGDLIDCNPAFLDIFGFDSIEAARDYDLSSLYPTRPSRIEFLELLREEKKLQNFRLEMRRTNGSPMWILENVIGEFDASGELVMLKGYLVDITDWVMIEDKLRQNEELYRGVFQSVPVSLIVLDREGNYIDINPFHINHIGKGKTAREDYIGTNVFHRSSIVKAGIADHFKRLLAGETILLTDLYFPTTTGGTEAYFNISGVPLLKNGEINGAVMIVEDITERQLAEKNRRQMEEQIQHTQKLESLGVLAGGIAHDFNNLLTGILGNTGLAQMELPSSSAVHGRIKKIESASVQAAELCKQLLAYSGRGRFLIQPLSINEIVREMARLLAASVTKKAALRYSLAENLPAVEVDAAQVRQIIMNLIINASEAIGEDSGIITVATGTRECDKSYLRSTYLSDDLPEGRYVYLDVTDTGCGMDEQTRNIIFDPFFTTKFTGRGLGLAAVLGIVRGHQGAIRIKSEPGCGSAFRILFPCSEKAGITACEPVVSMSEFRGEGTVLMVDDEELVRDLGVNTLSKAGFSVLTAANGQEALNIIRERSQDIQLVVLDMTMPLLSGRETFEEILRLKKNMQVILSSGYSEEEAISRFEGNGLAGFLQKPYKPLQLIEKVNQVMEKKSPV
jgi:two-component system cell cycle sensor histidine kinase/response regulator CckA